MPLFKRRDGDPVRDVPAYRRIMPFIMRGRNESAVYFEQRVDASAGVEFIRSWNARFPERKISFLHLTMQALVQALHERPRLNRFTMGGFLYQRRGIFLSYSAKKAFNDDAPVVVVKQRLEPERPFAELVAQVHGSVKEGKSDKPSHVDNELGLFLRLPAPILRFGVKLLAWLDAWNLLPFAFFRDDPMYASAFVASLGSVKLDAAFHHLYEYGNIPIFCVLGKLHDAPFARPDGSVGVRTELTIKWTYDERIEDGLYCAQTLETLRARLEDPQKWLGEVGQIAAAAG